MKTGILGSGDAARALGAGFLRHGHEVRMGTRTPAKLAEWASKNPKAGIGSFAEAAKFGEMAVLAVKGTAAAEVLRAAGRPVWRGRSSWTLRTPSRTPRPKTGC